MTDTIKEYLSKPYSRVITPDAETGTFTAQIAEFPGCIAEGNTAAEAYTRLEVAAEAWLEAAIEFGQPIPEPLASQTASGKVLLRLPKTLHKQSVDLAAREGVSLNQFLVYAVAENVGARNLYSTLANRLEKKEVDTALYLSTSRNVFADTSVSTHQKRDLLLVSKLAINAEYKQVSAYPGKDPAQVCVASNTEALIQ